MGSDTVSYRLRMSVFSENREGMGELGTFRTGTYDFMRLQGEITTLSLKILILS